MPIEMPEIGAAPPLASAGVEALSEGAFAKATSFIFDALANRRPNVRLAQSARLTVVGHDAADQEDEGDARDPQHQHDVLPPPGGTGRLGCVASWCSLSAMSRMLSSRLYRGLLLACALMHCMLIFWENTAVSPSTPPFSWTPGVFEGLFIAFYAANAALLAHAYGLGHFLDKRWELVLAAAAFLALLDWIIYYPAGARTLFRFSRPLRPLLFISQVRSLRRLLSSIILTIPRTFYVTLLLLILIMFYATAGMVLFNRNRVPGYSPHDDNFNDWLDSSLAIFVLSTTENYPNVANQAYRHRPVFGGIFFVSALFIILWLVVPLILATVYDSYMNVVKRQTQQTRAKRFASLVWAYQVLLGKGGDVEMDRGTFSKLIQRVRPMTDEDAALLFKALDTDDSGFIGLSEFLHLPNILRLVIERSAFDDDEDSENLNCFWRCSGRLSQSFREITSSRVFGIVRFAAIIVTCATSAVWSVDLQQQYNACMCNSSLQPPVDDGTPPDEFPTAPREGAPAPLLHVISHGVERCLREIGWLVSAAAPALYTAEESGGGAPPPHSARALGLLGSDDPTCIPGGGACGGNPIRWTMYVSMLALLVQVAEVTLRALAHRPNRELPGWRQLWCTSSAWAFLDVLAVAWALLACSVFLVDATNAIDPNVADFIYIGRAMPFLRIMAVLPGLKRIVDTVGSIIGLVGCFAVVYLAVSYTYVCMGIEIFGGVAQAQSAASCQQCQLYEMDTVVNAWLAILQVSVGNNWNSILYPLITGVGTRWAALYWVSYRWLFTDILLNIIEGVMLQGYDMRKSTAEEAEDAQRVEDVFQSSTSAAEAASAGSSVASPPSDLPTSSLLGGEGGAGQSSSEGALPPAAPARSSLRTSSRRLVTKLRHIPSLFEDMSLAAVNGDGGGVAPPDLPAPKSAVAPVVSNALGVGEDSTAAAADTAPTAPVVAPATPTIVLSPPKHRASIARLGGMPDGAAAASRSVMMRGVTTDEVALLTESLRQFAVADAEDGGGDGGDT